MAAASTTSRNIWWRRREMPEHLTWFKYESYFTWLSGFLMLCIVYYGGADLFLIDRTCAGHHARLVGDPDSRSPRWPSAGSSTTCSASRRSAKTPGA